MGTGAVFEQSTQNSYSVIIYLPACFFGPVLLFFFLVPCNEKVIIKEYAGHFFSTQWKWMGTETISVSSIPAV